MPDLFSVKLKNGNKNKQWKRFQSQKLVNRLKVLRWIIVGGTLFDPFKRMWLGCGPNAPSWGTGMGHSFVFLRNTMLSLCLSRLMSLTGFPRIVKYSCRNCWEDTYHKQAFNSDNSGGVKQHFQSDVARHDMPPIAPTVG